MLQNTINEIISERGLTPQEYSNLTDIPLKTVYNWLSDPTILPSWERIELICHIFQLELGSLVILINEHGQWIEEATDRDKYIRCYRSNFYKEQRNQLLKRYLLEGETVYDYFKIPVINERIYDDCYCVAPLSNWDFNQCIGDSLVCTHFDKFFLCEGDRHK